MFKITPIQDPETQRRYAELSGTKAVAGAFAYAMFDVESESPMGFSQFEIREDGGRLFDLRPIGKDDYEAMFILGRQTMNFIDLCGAHTAKASDEYTDALLLRAIGFKKSENGEYFCNMDGMFDGKHCSGEAVDLDKITKA